MINHKLLVVVISVAVFTILSVDFYQQTGFDVTEDSPPDQPKVAVNEDATRELHEIPFDKLICFWKVNLLSKAYSHMPNVDEAEFNQFCKNVTEIFDCFLEANFNEHFNHRALFGFVDAFYNCFLPYFQAVNNFCKLTFENAMDAQTCYKAAMKHYSGSPEQSECRETCCHDPSTFDASKPTLCGPENYDFYRKMRRCENLVLDQTLKDNDCMKVCVAKSGIRYAKNFCKAEAVHVLESFGAAIEKKFLTDQCFKKCPDDDES
uniref:Chondroitin proteoglycan 4 domain-containing protein n=1 Tax=Panagrellus redivivus TaxID=6233 RepID=A0A7E4V3W9_PANRE